MRVTKIKQKFIRCFAPMALNTDSSLYESKVLTTIPNCLSLVLKVHYKVITDTSRYNYYGVYTTFTLIEQVLLLMAKCS